MKLAATLAALLLLGGCGEAVAPAGKTSAPATRIVTLAPHLAEIVVAVDAADALVGVSAWTDYPPEAARKPIVGDAFALDLERLAELAPDLILAWDSGTPSTVVSGLEAAGYRVETVSSASLDEIASSFRWIGELVGRADAGRAAAGRFRDRLPPVVVPESNRLRVFYQIAAEPLYTIGVDHVISEIIGHCGGVSVFPDLEQAAGQVALESVLARDPQLVISAAGPGGLDRWRELSSLPVVRAGALASVPAELVARPGPRLADGARAICRAIASVRDRD